MKNITKYEFSSGKEKHFKHNAASLNEALNQFMNDDPRPKKKEESEGEVTE